MSPDSLRSLYEDNWKRMSGLQMSKITAEYGYKTVSTLSKGKALDIGCGDGTNASVLKEMGYTVEGCDISKNAVNKAIAKGIKAKTVDVNSYPIPYKNNAFDLIWLTDVIEHVFWPESLLAEIRRTLKSGGYLFLTTPNVTWWGIRLQILMGKTLKYVHSEHIHWFDLSELVRILNKYKFTISSINGYNCLIPHPLVQKLPILSSLNRMGRTSTIFTYTFAVLARKI